MAQAGSRPAGAKSTPAAEQTQTDSTPSETPSGDMARVAELEAEVDRLRAELADKDVQEPTSGGPEPRYVDALVDALVHGKPIDFAGAEVPTDVQRRLAAAGRLPGRPVEPSFGLSEGQRQELVATGKTVSPFTGAPQVGSGRPGEKPRVVSPAEHAKTPARPAGDK
ncbi:hypothetical protein ABT023_16275 [Micromonospora sp. NPDC002296]|uniref:hypothetical protein n=1 Tax=Micromonospora sp. NPDC002296 TaxID=3154271 RepID=UPI0033175864